MKAKPELGLPWGWAAISHFAPTAPRVVPFSASPQTIQPWAPVFNAYGVSLASRKTTSGEPALAQNGLRANTGQV